MRRNSKNAAINILSDTREDISTVGQGEATKKKNIQRIKQVLLRIKSITVEMKNSVESQVEERRKRKGVENGQEKKIRGIRGLVQELQCVTNSSNCEKYQRKKREES